MQTAYQSSLTRDPIANQSLAFAIDVPSSDGISDVDVRADAGVRIRVENAQVL